MHIYSLQVSRLVGLLIEQAASHCMCDLFILSNPNLGSKKFPIRTKDIRANDLI